jgi:hypothetical protein
MEMKMTKKHFDVVIATPGNSLDTSYVESLVDTTEWLNSEGLTYKWLNKSSSFVPSARELTATNTYFNNWETNEIGGGEFTYSVIVWIDSDISWDVEDFKKLYYSELEIVSGLYMTHPNGTVAVAFDNGSGLPRMVNESEFVLWYEPVEAWGVGFGFVAMKQGVFEKISRPWFEIQKVRWPELEFDNNVGEDYSWCMKAREAGYKVWVDPAVKVLHHKSTIYKIK